MSSAEFTFAEEFGHATRAAAKSGVG